MHRSHDLLIIDDDEALNGLLSEYLSGFGHHLRSATTAALGWAELRRRRPDLLILDVMLPDEDGLSLCRRVRRHLDVPIIMLTARGGVTDRVIGLELGADDYLPKPFEPRELVARIESVIRRSAEGRALEVMTCGPLRLEGATRRVWLEGQPLDLTSMEFELLQILMQSRGRVLTREQILLALRGFDNDVYDRSIDMLISRLRQKLCDDARSPRFIKTVWRTGYQFVGDAESRRGGDSILDGEHGA